MARNKCLPLTIYMFARDTYQVYEINDDWLIKKYHTWKHGSWTAHPVELTTGTIIGLFRTLDYRSTSALRWYITCEV